MPGAHSTLNSYTVYFIQGIDGGPIKIGHTVGSVRTRIHGLENGSPVKLRLLGVISGVNYEFEAELHLKFQHLRRHGEWFDPAPDLMAFIAERATRSDEISVRVKPLKVERPKKVKPAKIEARAPEVALEQARPATDIELAQARAILDLEKAGWLRADIFRALRISRMTYFRRLRLVRQVKKGKAG